MASGHKKKDMGVIWKKSEKSVTHYHGIMVVGWMKKKSVMERWHEKSLWIRKNPYKGMIAAKTKDKYFIIHIERRLKWGAITNLNK